VSQGCSEYIYITMHRKTLAITGKWTPVFYTVPSRCTNR
jgi:hypothetical protein